MYKELKRMAIERLIELIIKHNKERTLFSLVFVESYIDAFRTIFGNGSIDVFRDISLNFSPASIIYIKIRIYYSENLRYFYYEWKTGQTDYEVHVDTGDCL